MTPGGRFNAVNVPLRMLIKFAYHIDDAQLEGLPSWANSRAYSIEAVAPSDIQPNLPPDEMFALQRGMMQSLLADRFGLKAHRATKELPVYNLVVAKDGPKLKAATEADFAAISPPRTMANGPANNPSVAMAPPDAAMAPKGDAPARGSAPHESRRMRGPGMMMMGPGDFKGTAVNLSMLVEVLANDLGRVVVNKTGLTGNYDFELKWTPGPGETATKELGPPNAEQPASVDFAGPSIFTAVQEQLGLKLESAKGPVEVLVVDQVQPPTAD
jgi:uncharacterized protein (TIGR03435 family)